MTTHDVRDFTAGLSSRLASRSRHINLFLGAGSSKACGLPDVTQLQRLVDSDLADGHKQLFRRLVGGGNLETALSKIRRMVALLGVGDQIDGIDADTASHLDSAICEAIVRHLSRTEDLNLAPAADLAAWLVRANYMRPVDVFTVNYDLMIERSLDALGAPYFDGFGGILEARFRSDLVDAEPPDEHYVPSFFPRLWKLHGSLNWSIRDGAVVRLGSSVSAGLTAAIYPSDAKYDESRRVPFVVLQDRFRRALHEPETLTLVSGYSWGDEHLNEQVFDAAKRRPRSEVIAFCYSTIPDGLRERAIFTPNLQVVSPTEAILGGNSGTWSKPADETPPYIWSDGAVQLGDFGSLATFLARASNRYAQVEPSA